MLSSLLVRNGEVGRLGYYSADTKGGKSFSAALPKVTHAHASLVWSTLFLYQPRRIVVVIFCCFYCLWLWCRKKHYDTKWLIWPTFSYRQRIAKSSPTSFRRRSSNSNWAGPFGLRGKAIKDQLMYFWHSVFQPQNRRSRKQLGKWNFFVISAFKRGDYPQENGS